MDKKFIEKQKKSLLAEKERLTKKIKELKKFPDYGNTDEANAQEVTDFSNNLSLEERLEYLVKKIDKALNAIEKEKYGLCKSCKQAVEEGRLTIMPYADSCVLCSKK